MWENPAIQKTLSLLLFIGVGVILRGKIKSKESLGGVKVMILSIALPAMIFIALLKIEVEPHLLFLPILALGFNLLMLGVVHQVLPFFGVEKDSSAGRSLMMLLPSLAPGLSCFPFLIEYLGDESLALAALADVGNKIFVLIILYILAMRWYYQRAESKQSSNRRLKDLMLSLLKEPVNLMIVSALILLGFGLDLTALPAFLQSTVGRMSAMMTPLILLFIGMAVTIRWEQVRTIFSFLAFRSGFAFLLSGLALLFLPALTPAIALVVVVFPQSACSFWPFAHMAAVDAMEEKSKDQTTTFDTDLSLAVLACSLPFSSILILGICSIGSFFTNPVVLLIAAAMLLSLAFSPQLLTVFGRKSEREAMVKEATETLHS